VKDAQSSVQGRTRWRRFAVVAIPAAAAAGAIVFGMANGAIAAQLSVSGQQFTVTADHLSGKGFVQYGDVTHTTQANGKNLDMPAVYSGISDATLTNLCQSVQTPGLPVSLMITAGGAGSDKVHATNMLIAMTDLSGDATFTNIQIGANAGSLDAAGANAHGANGAFGQQAEGVEIDHLRQTAYSTTAGTFTLPGLKLHLDVRPSGNPAHC